MRRRMSQIDGANVLFGCSKLLRSALVAAAALVMIFPVAMAQSTKGSVVGHVTDTSGAVIVTAAVELKNVDTGAITNAKTDSSGEYTFSSVDPGTYNVTVTSKGFEQSVASGIVVDVAQTIRQDVKMSVGGATVTVDISSTSPVITTDSPEISSLIDNRQIEWSARRFLNQLL